MAAGPRKNGVTGSHAHIGDGVHGEEPVAMSSTCSISLDVISAAAAPPRIYLTVPTQPPLTQSGKRRRDHARQHNRRRKSRTTTDTADVVFTDTLRAVFGRFAPTFVAGHRRCVDGAGRKRCRAFLQSCFVAEMEGGREGGRTGTTN